MFRKKNTPELTDGLVKEIVALQQALETTSITDAEYEPTLKALERLYKLYQDISPEPLKKEAIVSAGAQVLGIGTVVGVEVLGSKLLNRNGLGMIRKF